MTDSLIPYSFVPGTKAKASEVNANFIAVADAISSSNTSITNLANSMNSSLENRLDLNMSNSHTITNCIVSAPNGVVTYSGLNITAKSGLKVLMPNGRYSDGTLKNVVYSLSVDLTVADSVSSGARVLAVTSSGNLIAFYKANYRFGADSSKPATLSDSNLNVYFATDVNKMYTSSGSTIADWTETPLCILGEYFVVNSSIISFDQAEILNLTNCANNELSNLSEKSQFNVLKPSFYHPMKIRTAGVMVTWGSRTYSKAYDDECIGAVTIDVNGYGSLCLVSETERGATGYDGYGTTPRISGTITYSGKTFYYFMSEYAMSTSLGLIKNSNTIPVLIHRLSSASAFALAILDEYYNSTRYSLPETSYVNGTWGYRVWGDGWKEFWGRATTTSEGQELTVSTPIGMANNCYSLVIQQIRANNSSSSYPRITGLYPTYFTFKGDSSAENIWYACGY